jgi:hypothetical protein
MKTAMNFGAIETSKATPKDYNYYKNREAQLNRILCIITNRLEWYKAGAEKIVGNWSEADQERFKHWNDWHDREYRIKNLLWDNYSDYQTYCFTTYGVSVIDFENE